MTLRTRGLVLVLVGASLFGISGTVAQELFQHYGATPQWLVGVRMLGGGALLYAILRPPFPRGSTLRFLAYALVGLLGVQFTYMAAINASNAATATIIQYLGVPMIAVYELATAHRRPTLRSLVPVVLAVAGTALLVLGGPGGVLQLHVSVLGLVYGLLTAGCLAFFTLVSAPLVARHGAWPVTTWALLAGGAAMALFAPPWQATVPANPWLFAGMTAFVAVLGTAGGFGFFQASLAYLAPTEAGVAATFEPIMAAATAFLFLHVLLAPLQYLGGAFILLAVVLLQMSTTASGRGTSIRRPQTTAAGPPAP